MDLERDTTALWGKTQLMRNSMRFVVLVLAALLARASTVTAQEMALPSAAEVIARYVKASHVDLLVKSHRSTRIKGKMEVPTAAITGTVVEIRSKPNVVMQMMSVPGRGESKGGFDGQNGWSLDPTSGPKLMTGDELNDARITASFTLPLRDTTLYKTRETVELAEYGAQKCYKLRMVTQAGRESFECFSVETGLLVAAQRKVTSPLGLVDNVTLYSDYKNFGGAMLASRIVSEMRGIRQIRTIESVSFDDVQPDELALPPQVKALIKP